MHRRLGLCRHERRCVADTPVATTTRPTPIRSWGGVAAFSLYDPASGGYRLAVSRHGGPPEAAPRPGAADRLRPRCRPRRVRLARDRVLALCDNRPRPRGCDLYRYSLSAGSESKLAGASSPEYVGDRPDDLAQTCRLGTPLRCSRNPPAADLRPHAYFAAVASFATAAGHSVPPVRQRRLCRQGLEFRGRRLAMNVGYPGPVCNNGQIRLGSLARRAIRIADTTCGLDGQPSSASRSTHATFTSRAFATRAECDPRVGAFRYSLRAARYSLAAFGRAPDRLLLRGRRAGLRSPHTRHCIRLLRQLARRRTGTHAARLPDRPDKSGSRSPALARCARPAACIPARTAAGSPRTARRSQP